MSTFEIYKCKHGQIAHYTSDDTIGRSLAKYGEWAEEEIYLISRYLKTGDTVLDIGANIGSHSLAFSKIIGENGFVIAIDAQYQIFKILCMNVLINELENILCLNALASDELTIEFTPYKKLKEKSNYGATSYLQRSTKLRDMKAPILGMTIDSLKLSYCNLIKIDVEGMELSVLRGSYDTLIKFKPYVYFEQTSSNGLKDIFSYLKDIGYTMYWHVANPYNSNNFNNEKLNIFGGTCEVNIFAIPKDKNLSGDKFASLVEIVEPIYNPPHPVDAISGWKK
jgi:FkbM family methyltransferase